MKISKQPLQIGVVKIWYVYCNDYLKTLVWYQFELFQTRANCRYKSDSSHLKIGEKTVLNKKQMQCFVVKLFLLNSWQSSFSVTNPWISLFKYDLFSDKLSFVRGKFVKIHEDEILNVALAIIFVRLCTYEPLYRHK